MATQPAGEHHTGTLNLAGEGNAPGPSDRAIEATAKAIYENPADSLSKAGWDAAPSDIQAIYRFEARAALEAAYPAIRQQVAEEIAVECEKSRALYVEAMDADGERSFALAGTSIGLTKAAEIAREIGSKS